MRGDSLSTSRKAEVCGVQSIRNEVNLLLRNRQRRHQDLINFVSNYYDQKLIGIPRDILNKPVSKLTSDDLGRIKNGGVAVSSNDENSPLLRASHAKRNTHKRLAPLQMKMNKLQTPANQRLPTHHLMGTVTPKFNPCAPMSVVRVPKDGEVAMSLTGSPLRVTSLINESRPNVIVPLEHGRILSVLPERGLRRSQIPEMNEELINQLQVLHDNLNTLLSIPPKCEI